MISYFLMWYRFAKVRAELEKQIKDKKLVTEICQHPESLRMILSLFNKACYRKRRDATFLIVCSLLTRTIKDSTLPNLTRIQAYLLLDERYNHLEFRECYEKHDHHLVQNFAHALESYKSLLLE